MSEDKYYHGTYSCNGKADDGKYHEYATDSEYVEMLREERKEKRNDTV